MKLKKTRPSGTKDRLVTNRSASKPLQKPQTNTVGAVDDVVEISTDALAAAGAAKEATGVTKTEKTSERNSLSGPLPDPRATSQAILERELDAVFKEIYV